MNSRGLRGHLAVQVDIHGAVDGDEVVDLRHPGNVVHIADGSSHALRVVVDEVIQLLCARREGIGLPAPVKGLAQARDATGYGHVHEGVHVHLGVHAQILQVALGDHLADGVGHRADAQLQAGTVTDLRHHQFGHRHVHLTGGSAAAQLIQSRGLSLHDHVHVVDVDAVLKPAQAHGHVLVDLHDDGLCALAHSLQVGAAGTEIEPAVLVHGGHLEHGHVQALDAVAVIPRQLRIPQGDVIGEALAHGLALDAAHVPGVPAEMLRRIGHIENGGLVGQDTAPDLHVGQLAHPPGQRLIQGIRRADAPAVIHPVAGLDGLDRLVGRCQLLFVHFLVAHVDLPPVIPVCCMMSSVLSYIDCQEYNIPALEKQSIP